MDSKKVIEEFESTWKYTRKMTTEFIKCVPEEKWNFSHHPKFGALSKQFRHMVGVYGCYIDTFRTKQMDLSKKKTFCSSLNKNEILSLLEKMDDKLSVVLTELKETDLSQYQVDFFGQKMGFSEYSHVLIQHECAHFGIWSNYAAFGEFETPKMWQNDWEL